MMRRSSTACNGSNPPKPSNTLSMIAPSPNSQTVISRANANGHSKHLNGNGHNNHQAQSPSNGHPQHYVNGNGSTNGISNRSPIATKSASPSTSPRSSRRRRRRNNNGWMLRRRKKGSSTLPLLVISCGVLLLIVMILRRRAQVGGNSSQDLDLSTTTMFQKFTQNAPVCSVSGGSNEEHHQQHSRRLHPIDVSYTLVTQLSDDRLWMMEYHCERWGYDNPISIAILSNQTYDDITSLLIEEYSCHGSQLTVQIVDASLYPDNDYPVNTLRNIALRGIKTTHVVYIDVDFWESEGIYETLMKDTIRKALAEDYKRSLVIPAWQLFRQCTDWVDCRDENIPYMPFSLHELYEMLSEKRGFIFDPTNKGGHGSTRYKDWLHQQPGSLLDIECLVSKRYEPFLVFRYCNELPPFQEQFTGYGKNKMTWALQMLRSGYKMSQVGGIYLVHYPHLDSKSRLTWNQAPDEMIQVMNKTKMNAKAIISGVNDHEQHHDNDNSDPQELFGRILRPHQAKGPVDFMKYKRGQVDDLFIKFRSWLQDEIPDETQIPLCDEAKDDDSKLWISSSLTSSSRNVKKKEQEQ